MDIQAERLWNRLMRMAEIGGTPKGGVCRVALTPEDKEGRELFIQWCKQAGCSIRIDQIGNIFARREGRKPDLSAVLVGSHLDSQPTGGKYDGVLGVLAGLEIVESLNDADIQTDRPIEIVSWTNEEGARFAPAMIGSGVFAGEFSLEYAYSRTDKLGMTLGTALEEIGYKGSATTGESTYYACLELHIEQGPILEAEEIPVGIVKGVQGIRWYDLLLTGKETHAGPCPMSFRQDPMKACGQIMQAIYRLAEDFAPDARATLGYLDASPGVKNTVPGTVTLSIDIRHPDVLVLTEIDKKLREHIQAICEQEKIGHELQDIWYSPPVVFHERCTAALIAAAKKLQVPYKEMVSGAGHDSVYLSKVAPTAMVFIPCKDGLSHNELESAKQADAAVATRLMLEAVRDLSKE
ncbi:MAG: Zn-dependent hydrolase [Bacteroidota bacterium]